MHENIHKRDKKKRWRVASKNERSVNDNIYFQGEKADIHGGQS